MGAIEDVYEDLEADVDRDEFEASVREKVEQMDGLADEETAAMLVAHELRESGGEVDGVADVEPDMDEVKFVAKVTSVGEVRTFERDGEDEPDGKVANVEVADETGRVRISLWDDLAEGVERGELEVGQVLRVAGRPKDGYSGVEVSVDRAEVDEDVEIDVQVQDVYRVEDLSLGLSDVDLRGRVLATDRVRTFDRDDGSEGRVSNLTLGDPTGRVRVTLWDERADRATELATGESVEVVDGYTRERDGDLELHVGSRGAVESVDDEVEYVPETSDIGSVELDDVVDLSGGVIETSDLRTFDRDDGSQGQVRNVRLRDETGDIRVALWGDHADADLDLGDHVLVTDVEIGDGWQEDLEAAANWRSTVSVVDREPVTADDDEAAAGADASTGSDLSSFADGGTAVADEGGADGPTDGDEAEFTGTVVQTGDPVVLDDGQRTRSVETDADLRLGEQVTVRGRLRDGRIDADELTR
jgi:replication factor A1